MFQPHSGCGLSLGDPSPSRLLRLERLNGTGILDALWDRSDVSDPPSLLDGCRLPEFVEKLSLE